MADPRCCHCGGALAEKTLREIERMNRVSAYFNAKALCDHCWEKAYPELAAKKQGKEVGQHGPKRSRKTTADIPKHALV